MESQDVGAENIVSARDALLEAAPEKLKGRTLLAVPLPKVCRQFFSKVVVCRAYMFCVPELSVNTFPVAC
jgi:hypothetical protein